ncbi:MAG: DNA-processing protein DprA [Porphyromonas sp.]|nr:DNA-processing protein DprA [Porphyromonas sp.]
MSQGWTREERALLTLSCTERLGAATARALIEHFGSAAEVLEASPRALAEVPGVGRKLISILMQRDGAKIAEEEMALLRHRREIGDPIDTLFVDHEGYPASLAHCNDAPLVLYVRGKIPIDAPMLAVVGTRQSTHYAADALDRLFTNLAQLCPELVIVSGLAYGVDQLAHSIALEKGLRTIAVVAHGHYTLYPSAHRELAREIMTHGGAVVTEYRYNTRALPQRFVARNRIVAGLSSGTLVVESPKKGGALITASIAFDYGRSLFALPGRLFDKTSEGCNRLIAFQKATLLLSAEQLLEELNLLPDLCSPTPLPFGNQEPESEDDTRHPILAELAKVDVLTLEDLSMRLGMTIPEVSAQLFDLELDGKIRALPGGRYVLRHN